MDLSVQKMQPPATVQGKSAAKKTNPGSSEDAIEDVARDEDVRFKHGGTGYEEVDPDEKDARDDAEQRQGRRKNRQLLSRDDLSELTSSLEQLQQPQSSADGLMNMRAYQSAPPPPEEQDDRPRLEMNI